MNTKTIIGIVIAIVVIGGLALYFNQKIVQTAAPAVTQEAPAKEFTLIIAEKKLVTGPETISVKKGDTVVIHITNDEEEEFHLHGYDRSVDLTPGVASDLRFAADTAGRFPAELEGSKTDIITLEVIP